MTVRMADGHALPFAQIWHLVRWSFGSDRITKSPSRLVTATAIRLPFRAMAAEIAPMFAMPHVLLGFSDTRSFLLAFCLGLLFSQGCAMLQRAPVSTQHGTTRPTIEKSPPVQAKLTQTGK